MSGPPAPADTEWAMDAAPAHDLHGRGAPRLLRHFAALDLLTRDGDAPSIRARLERELGGDLADLLLDVLAGPDSRESRRPRSAAPSRV
jgi:hypothetical protein